jgi:hypothetical protein
MHRVITANEWSAWVNEDGHLAKEMTDWIASNMGQAAAARAVDMNGPGYDFSGMPIVSAQHVAALNWLNKVSVNLAALQREPEGDNFKPRMPGNVGSCSARPW